MQIKRSVNMGAPATTYRAIEVYSSGDHFWMKESP